MNERTEQLSPTDNLEFVTPKETSLEQIKEAEKVNGPEDTIELSPRDLESRAEKARAEALETAASTEKKKGAEIVEKDKAPKQRSVSKKQRDISYKRTMKHVQEDLSFGSRLFSKTIHNKVIEKTSDVLGSTIARPNAILSGAVMAFIFTLAMYVIAKNFGYVLSGFETIVAFVAGWVVGVIYDYLRVLFTGKNA